ncbi:MAG: acyl-CoA dehydrogenase [Planctomycetes bacterium]|nr:acyl-CoA dehydrogenase [Planctomycetota bacterium]
MSTDTTRAPELTEEQELLQQTVRDYVRNHVAPHAAKYDEAESFPEIPWAKARELGLCAITIPEVHGGTAMGTVAASIVVEEVSRVCPSTAVTLSVHNSLVSSTIAKHANDAQRQRFLPNLASGEWLGAYCLSEAGAGTDASDQQTTAVRKGDRFVLNGAKLWITSGTHAGLFIVFARTSTAPDLAKRSRGVSCFIVERATKGVSIGKKEEKLGIRASPTTEVLLQDCEIPADNLIGELDKGFRIAMDALDVGRIGIASQALGIAQGCFDESLKYAKERRQFGRPIAEFQAIQWKLADMATGIDAARLLTRRAARMRDAGEPCAKEAAMAKLFASILANRTADEAVQIHGSAGYSREYLVERLFRDARITEIYEGTTEAQRMVIARALLG